MIEQDIIIAICVGFAAIGIISQTMEKSRPTVFSFISTIASTVGLAAVLGILGLWATAGVLWLSSIVWSLMLLHKGRVKC